MNIKRFLLITILVLLPASLAYGLIPEHKSDYVRNRTKLLSYIINKQITDNHYYHEPLNDKLSSQAFKLYLKQLDPRKLFFLQKDVEALNGFKLQLDDEVRSGYPQFPLVAGEILKERAHQVKGFLDDIAASKIDLNKPELLEVDSKKLNYCASKSELKERWRKNITYQIAAQYLDLQEIAAVKDEGKNKTEKRTKKTLDITHKAPQDFKKAALKKVMDSNQDLVRRILERDNQDNYDRFFSTIARALDPHSTYMPPSQKEDFDIHMRGSLEGIGAVLQEEDGYIKVVRVIPGGAAYRQKHLNADDVILMVAQGTNESVDISGMKLRDAVSLIRGKKGSLVRLTVKKPDGSVVIIPIIRDVVQLEDTFVKSAVIPQKNTKLRFGYIKIPSFYRDFQGKEHGGDGRNVTDDMRKALLKLSKQNINGLVIDLRNNGGGALVDAVKIAGLFIDKGPVVQIRANKRTTVLCDTDAGISYNGPMIIMINRFSASASEIFAGAMQDYGRALIVGSEHSYGKGTVQTLINLDDNLPFLEFNMLKYEPLGALKLTTQKFYRINGGSTQDRGVLADIVFPDRLEYAKVGEKYAENAMPWDKIAPASYTKWPHFIFNIPALKALNAKIMKTNKKFIEITKEAEEAQNRQQHTLINIDLDSLRNEREKLANIRKAGGDAPYDHGSLSGYPDSDTDHEMTKKEEKKAFVEHLDKDPAVQESFKLLRATLS